MDLHGIMLHITPDLDHGHTQAFLGGITVCWTCIVAWFSKLIRGK